MKKYVILMGVTAFVVAAVLAVPFFTGSRSVAVTLVTIEEKRVCRTVECNGRVALADSEDVMLDLPCIAGQVYVQEGDTVKAGDPLFSVDISATQSVLSQLGTSLEGSWNEGETTIVAPRDGIVTSLNVKKGELTVADKPCAVISPDKTVQVAVTIREKYLQSVKIGQAVEVRGVGFEKDVYYGVVTSIADTAHQQYVGTSTETVVDAVVTLDTNQADDSLRVGLGATASVVVDTVERGVVIPYSCVAQDEEGNEYVYVYNGNGTAHRQVLENTEDYPDGVLVLSGISAGWQVVDDPEQLTGDTVSVYGA